MGFGFYQLALDRKSKDWSIFQTHQGLHRMERLYFNPTSATGIFHNEGDQCLRGVPGCTTIHGDQCLGGVPGCTTIHDNILVGGNTAIHCSSAEYFKLYSPYNCQQLGNLHANIWYVVRYFLDICSVIGWCLSIIFFVDCGSFQDSIDSVELGINRTKFSFKVLQSGTVTINLAIFFLI